MSLKTIFSYKWVKLKLIFLKLSSKSVFVVSANSFIFSLISKKNYLNKLISDLNYSAITIICYFILNFGCYMGKFLLCPFGVNERTLFILF